MEDSPKKNTVHRIMQLVNERPGISSRQLAAEMGVRTEDIGGRLYNLANSKTPRIKRMRMDGAMRYFPLEHKLTTDPVRERPSVPVTVDGEVIRITKVTAEELIEIEREKRRGKYAEIIDVLATLPTGDAIFVPRDKISADGLRGSVRAWFKDSKTFNSMMNDQYITLIRVS